MENQENAGVNTVLIVILLLIVVGALVWFLSARTPNQPAPAEPNDTSGINIDVELPGGDPNSPPQAPGAENNPEPVQ